MTKMQDRRQCKNTHARNKRFFPEKIEVVKQSKIDTVCINDIINLQKEIIITSFDTGYYKIPELKSYFKNKDKLDSIVSEHMFFKVHSVKLDKN